MDPMLAAIVLPEEIERFLTSILYYRGLFQNVGPINTELHRTLLGQILVGEMLHESFGMFKWQPKWKPLIFSALVNDVLLNLSLTRRRPSLKKQVLFE